MQRRTKLLPPAAAMLLGATIALAGCGDEDDARASSSESSMGDEAPALCQPLLTTYTTTNRAFSQFDFETADEAEIGVFLGELSGRLEPMYEQIRTAAPEELAEVVDRRIDVARRAMETGEEDTSPQAEQDEAALDRFAIENCDVTHRPVVLDDREIKVEGSDAGAGIHAFALENEDNEPHEFAVIRVPESVEPSTIVDDPGSGERVGGTFLEPGDATVTFVDVEPGRYVLACFLPGERGTHASEGMSHEIEVR